jgi:RNA polymerase sigma factor (sigma-70 family)
MTSRDDFDATFDRMAPRAFRLALRILGDAAAAEDVAAEALARTFARWKELNSLPYLDGWILRVATNLAVDATRRRRMPVAEEIPIDVEELATVRAGLAAALFALPRRQREAVALRYLAGMNDTEIAATMEISHGAVKSHIARGLSSLRKRMGAMSVEEAPSGTA